MPRPKTEPIVRFRRKWKLSETHSYNGEPCWEWTAFKNNCDYGYFWIDGRLVLAHRWAFEHFREEIPETLLALHHCDNPPCVNPDHLFRGTHADNTRDMVKKGRHHNARKSHCLRGHPYSEENTYVKRNGCRNCKTCRREALRRSRTRRAA